MAEGFFIFGERMVKGLLKKIICHTVAVTFTFIQDLHNAGGKLLEQEIHPKYVMLFVVLAVIYFLSQVVWNQL